VTVEGEVIGDEPLADGMKISVRMRRDFTVDDAGRLLAAARRIYGEAHPSTSEEEVHALIACGADAIFTILEHAGVLGDATDERLAPWELDGLSIGGQRAQVTVDEPDPLPSGWDCFHTATYSHCRMRD
jgi:hypothetical protein